MSTFPPSLAPIVNAAPTSGPAAPTSGPITCFSGQSTVEVHNDGHIPLNQLRIGDFVNTRDDVFTQVYGFGHWDLNQDGTFLRITYDHSSSNDTVPKATNQASFLEISSRHMVMIDKDGNNIIFRLPMLGWLMF
jgi:Hint module